MTDTYTTKFRGRIIEVGLETVVLPNGARCELEIVRHPGGAAAVALDDANRVCLLHQYRHVVGGWIWELPAGKIDDGEPPLETAQRELAEEAGRQATSWLPLGSSISSPGVFSEVIHLFLARDLTAVTQNAEAHEVFEVHWVPFDEALDRALDGDIDDAKSVVGLLRAARVLE